MASTKATIRIFIPRLTVILFLYFGSEAKIGTRHDAARRSAAYRWWELAYHKSSAARGATLEKARKNRGLERKHSLACNSLSRLPASPNEADSGGPKAEVEARSCWKVICGDPPLPVARLTPATGHRVFFYMSGKVLLVVDDPAVRRMLVRILTEEGFSVSAARDRREAFLFAAGETFQLLLLDID